VGVYSYSKGSVWCIVIIRVWCCVVIKRDVYVVYCFPSLLYMDRRRLFGCPVVKGPGPDPAGQVYVFGEQISDKHAGSRWLLFITICLKLQTRFIYARSSSYWPSHRNAIIEVGYNEASYMCVPFIVSCTWTDGGFFCSGGHTKGLDQTLLARHWSSVQGGSFS
jgi:hypothetical protein